MVQSLRHTSASRSSARSRRPRAASSRRPSRSRSRSRRRDAVVEDQKTGEIVLSLDETNALRRSLGLKPLVTTTTTKHEANVVHLEKSRAQVDAERVQDEIQRQVQQSKTRRALRDKLPGQSLGEQLQATKATNVLEWVKASRAKTNEKNEKEDEDEKKKDENEAACDLAGMTIGHAVEAFQAGDEVILTLADATVLDPDGKHVNDAPDELVNVSISEHERRHVQAKRAKRAAQPVYCGYDDEDEWVLPSRKRTTKTKLLAQYDEEKDAEAEQAARKFQLDATGGVSAKKVDVEEKDESTVTVISLGTTVCPSTSYRKRPKKRPATHQSARRVHEGLEWLDQLEHEALQADAMGTNDRGKRTEHEVIATAEQAVEATRDVPVVRKKKRVVDDHALMDDALELDMSLIRARQWKPQATPSVSEARIAQLVAEKMGTNESTEAVRPVEKGTMAEPTGSDKVGHVFGDVRPTLHPVVLNHATDFETRLREAMEQRAAQFQAASDENRAVVTEETPIVEKLDDEREDKKGWGDEQPLVGTGVGATLALLRKTGELRQTRSERQAGRANDVRDRSVEDAFRVKSGVNLDYRDEFGRLLTKKEAFRRLSYKFHGHEPGKKKKEKRLKQLKEELAAQKQMSGEGSSHMMKVLEKKQRQSKEAHVVLSSGG
ncbi:hypothetical protein PsorP6_012688 [Peronosclerospora sorghi]|uniref:Uncharacterized protein n=1 Tax=Peronosclerospora sorghi TaxID=230839 RepID=A0ACC0WJ14_9STRA|nr:hypothetical protein PsorP6_012688 [Peronosclerospora sorghi]